MIQEIKMEYSQFKAECGKCGTILKESISSTLYFVVNYKSELLNELLRQNWYCEGDFVLCPVCAGKAISNLLIGSDIFESWLSETPT